MTQHELRPNDVFQIGETQIRHQLGSHREEPTLGGEQIFGRPKPAPPIAPLKDLVGQLASEEDVKRFYAEAEAAANLDHPGIVPIFEVGAHEGHHYFSMGYVEGQSLADKLKGGPLPPREAAEYTHKVAEAIAFAHGRGVIHLDLKPGNVLLDRSGAPKVTDFGLAKKVQDDRGLTATGQILGTPSYMPPEQAAGKVSEIKEPADIYALGAILYALVTGRPPFESDNPLGTLLQVLEREPVPPRQFNRKVPHDLETICLKCLQKESHQRYGSARDLADDIQRYLEGEPIVARPLGPLGRLRRWALRRPALATTPVALSLFYANHLVSAYALGTPGETRAFHQFVTGLVVVWALGAATFQYLARRLRHSSLVICGWAAMDMVLFTGFLFVADGPKSTVLLGYPLLVAATALRFHLGLMWFTTGLAVLGYLGLVLHAYRESFRFLMLGKLEGEPCSVMPTRPPGKTPLVDLEVGECLGASIARKVGDR